MCKIDWDKFKKGELVVHCKNKMAAKEFIKKCYERNIKWFIGDECYTHYDVYGADTVYVYSPKLKSIQYGDINYYINSCTMILEYIKDELTFKEIIENNIDGTYVNCNAGYGRINSVTVSDGFIEFDGNFEGITNVLGIIPDVKFKLQECKQEYTLFEVIHEIGGEHYLFRSDMNTNLKPKDFVICDTKKGKTFGRITDVLKVELTEEEYMQYKKCWRN